MSTDRAKTQKLLYLLYLIKSGTDGAFCRQSALKAAFSIGVSLSSYTVCKPRKDRQTDRQTSRQTQNSFSTSRHLILRQEGKIGKWFECPVTDARKRLRFDVAKLWQLIRPRERIKRAARVGYAEFSCPSAYSFTGQSFISMKLCGKDRHHGMVRVCSCSSSGHLVRHFRRPQP